MRKCLNAILLCVLLMNLTFGAAAEATYASYTYDEWNNSVSIPTGYTVKRTVYGSLTESGAWSGASDMCVTEQGHVLLADTGNNRILEYDGSFALVRVISEVYDDAGTGVEIVGPTGLHISDDGKLYIAMQSAARILVVDFSTLHVELVIENLEHALLGDDFKFSPSKVGADNAGRMYILSSGCYSGLLQFSPQGEFMGYYGSNKVTVTAKVLFQYYWKMIMTDEQRGNMTSILPVEYSNLHCGTDGFVYASTVGTESPVNQVKRLNPLGNNTYLASSNEEINFGDYELATVKKVSDTVEQLPTFVDVVTTEDCEFIFAVDRAYGRVFERDRSGNLIAVFGALGNQEGTFIQPEAIELLGTDVLVLDTAKGCIICFEPTEYTRLVHSAVEKYNAGEYEDSRILWEEVLRRNTNATQAYAGVGRALLKENRYREAMEYFRLGDSREEYSQAYRIVRLNSIRDAAPWVVCVLVGLYVLVKVMKFFLRRHNAQKKSRKNTVSCAVKLAEQTVFPKTLLHPFDGFYRIRFEQKTPLWPSAVILLLFVMASIYQYVGTGYLFNTNNIADINLWLLLGKSLGVVLVFIAAEWSVSILTDGSGRLRDILVVTSYALAPYVAGLFAGTWLSNFMILDEMYAQYIITIGMLWGMMLLVIGTMTIHELTFTHTLGFLLLTIAAMAIILFVGVLFYSLLLQLCTFVYTLYIEIIFRL